MFIKNFKQSILYLVVFCMLFSLPVMAQEPVADTFFTDAFQLQINGSYVDAPVYATASGSVYLPLRLIAESLGYEVTWNGADRSIHIDTTNPKEVSVSKVAYRHHTDFQSKEINVYQDSYKIYVDNQDTDVYTHHISYNGTTYMIMSGFYRALNCEIVYDDIGMTVRVYGPDYVTFGENDAAYFNEKMISNDQFTDLCKFVYKGAPQSGINTGYQEVASYLLMNSAYMAAGDQMVDPEGFADFYKTYESTMDDYGITDKNFFTTTVLKDYYYRNALTPQLVSDYFNPTDEELNAILATTSFAAEPYMKAKHILIMDNGDGKGLTKAEEILKELKKNPEKFDELMAQYSEDPGSKAQPEGYLFKAGDMVPEFYEGALALEVGEISDPVKTSYGYHIILKVADYKNGVPLFEVEDVIKEAYAQETMYQLLVNEMAKTNVVINRDYQNN